VARPAVARQNARPEREGAIRAYEKLNSLGIRRLAAGRKFLWRGLVLGACFGSGIPLRPCAGRRLKSGRKFSELKNRATSAGPSAGFKEAEYLKVIYLKFAT